MKYLIFALTLCFMGACTKDTMKTAAKINCDWQIMESYPEQVRGHCTLDVSQDQLEVKLADLAPRETTLVVEINGKVLEKSQYKYESDKNILLIKGLGEDMRSGSMKISYTALRDPITMETEGTIEDASKLDGCTFLIKLSDGQKLQPVNLGEEFKVNNLAVTFKYKTKPDMMSACMSGTIVEIVSMAKK